jgi:hypothetical protein
MTVKARYHGERIATRRLAAVLRVIERLESHAAAEVWYRARGIALPSNCIVPGNPPRPLSETNGMPPASVRARISGEADPDRAVRLWNATYRARVRRWPVFLVTEAEFLELRTPPAVTDDDLIAAFGRVPATLTPPAVPCADLDHLIGAVTARSSRAQARTTPT